MARARGRLQAGCAFGTLVAPALADRMGASIPDIVAYLFNPERSSAA